MAFDAKLRELREAAGLSQGALAEKAGMSKGGVADLEQGRRKPAWETVQKLAAALGVECTAFNEPVTEEKDPPGRGRPRKPAGDDEPAAVEAPPAKTPKSKRRTGGGHA